MPGFHPILARTRSFHRSAGTVAHDGVKVILARDGTAISLSEFGQKPVGRGT